jgi:hypothetical protein
MMLRLKPWTDALSCLLMRTLCSYLCVIKFNLWWNKINHTLEKKKLSPYATVDFHEFVSAIPFCSNGRTELHFLWFLCRQAKFPRAGWQLTFGERIVLRRRALEPEFLCFVLNARAPLDKRPGAGEKKWDDDTLIVTNVTLCPLIFPSLLKYWECEEYRVLILARMLLKLFVPLWT